MTYRSLRRLVWALIVFSFVPPPERACAQVIDDVMVRYAGMVITKTVPGYLLTEGALYRHNVEAEVGRGPFTLGLIYQITDKRGPVRAAPQRGLMLTAGYHHLLSYNLRLESFARIGLSSNINFASPLYATDTDLRVNVVAFHPDGVGSLAGKSFYPSGYVGGIANRFGRVQGITGAGVWWNRFSAYLTFFYAFNGVKDPVHPGPHADKAAAVLNNSGLSLSLSYEFKDVLIQVKRNVALRNGGNDLSVTLQYRFFLRKEIQR